MPETSGRVFATQLESGKLSEINGRESNLPLLPIAIAALVIVIANAIFIAFRILLPYPQSPWEAGILSDAWRMLHGEAVYANSAAQATHVYGPLVLVMLSQVFRFTGFVLPAGRIISTVAGLGVVVLLTRIFGRAGGLIFLVATALLLAANCRTETYFTETRPDLDSIFCGLLGLIALYKGLEPAAGRKSRSGLVVAGSVLLVIAMLFKQTAVQFSLIPVLAVWLGMGRRITRSQIGAVAVPITAMLLTAAGVWLLAPGVWYSAVTVLMRYHISVLQAGRLIVELLMSLPLFLLALVHWLLSDAAETWRLPRTRWLIAALICTFPLSISAAAKLGGAQNSLIPVFFATAAFCVWRIPAALALLRDSTRAVSVRVVAGSALGISLFTQLYPVTGALSYAALTAGHGVADRGLVIAEVRTLPGKLVSPDDPTIALAAKGYAGRSAEFEEDAIPDWNPAHAAGLMKELDSADYVIAVRHTLLPNGKFLVSSTYPELDETLLKEHGFTRIPFRTTSTPAYELWHRAHP